MNLSKEILQYPVELEVQRMHLENELTNLIDDWVDNTIESMTLSELKEKVEFFKQNQEEIREIRIGRPEPEVEEEDIKVSAKDLWL